MDSLDRIHVLLVEDDARLARFTADYLRQQGVIVDIAQDGITGASVARQRVFDAVILDLMLPGRDGLEVCRELRGHSGVPILMVTARHDEIDRVLGLELGADDYIPKPFSTRELLARIRAVVRRARGHLGPVETIQVGGLVLHRATQTATLQGRPVDLTSYEFSLLWVLAERRGRILSREQLLELVRGTAEESFDRSIDVRISRIRQKLGEDPRRPSMLRTVRGAGYCLAAQGDP